MYTLLFGIKINDRSNIEYIDQLIHDAQDLGLQLVIYETLLSEIRKYVQGYTIDLPIYKETERINDHSISHVISVGGDGTILRALLVIGHHDIPILGINLGRMGFLASIEKSSIRRALKKMVKGYYTIDARSVLYVQSNMDMFNDFPYGLNDFTVSKRDTSSMITLHTYIDDVLLNSYWADGLIVSTPTGSTGYSLSCGGPIIFPDAANFIITPIAPHNLNVRPIVISNEKTISIRVEGRTQNFMCTLDSRYQTITDEHHITINKADFDFKFILLEGQSFINTMNEKLLWGLDKRN